MESGKEVGTKVHGYHIKKINKGVLGERSKIVEEYNEWVDSCEQHCKIMELVELSDLLGAIDAYINNSYNMNLNDLIMMKDITERAFKNGRR